MKTRTDVIIVIIIIIVLCSGILWFHFRNPNKVHKNRAISSQSRRIVVEHMPKSGWGDNLINMLSGYVFSRITNRELAICSPYPFDAAFGVCVEHIRIGQNETSGCDRGKCLSIEFGTPMDRNMYEKFALRDIEETIPKHVNCVHVQSWSPLYMYVYMNPRYTDFPWSQRDTHIRTMVNQFFTDVLAVPNLKPFFVTPDVVHIRAGDCYMNGKSDNSGVMFLTPKQIQMIGRKIVETVPEIGPEILTISDWDRSVDEMNRTNDPSLNITYVSASDAHTITHTSDLKTENDEDTRKSFLNTMHDFFRIASATRTVVTCEWTNFGKLAALLGSSKKIYIMDQITLTPREVTDSQLHMKRFANNKWTHIETYESLLQ